MEDFVKAEELSDNPTTVRDLYFMALEYSTKLLPEAVFLEVGTRKGGSAISILQGIRDSGVNRWLFTVDPYGDKPYIDSAGVHKMDYGNEMYREMILQLSTYASENDLWHLHWKLEANQYLALDVNPWVGSDVRYGLAFLDGEHHDKAIVSEVLGCLPRMVDDGVIIVDDARFLHGSDDPVMQKILKESTEENDRLILRLDGPYRNLHRRITS